MSDFEILPPELLADWLSAENESERRTVLSAHASTLSRDAADVLLGLAGAGPGYGGFDPQEAALQRSLCALTRATAEAAQAWDLAAEACRLSAGLEALGSEAAGALLAQAMDYAQRAEVWPRVHHLAHALAAHALEARRPRQALAALGQALTACCRPPGLRAEGQETAEALVGLAERHGHPEAAWQPVADWLRFARGSGDLALMADANARLGHVARLLGRDDEAAKTLGEAAALYGELDDLHGLVTTTISRASLAFASGDQDAAVRRVEELMRLRSRVDDPELLALIDEGIL